MVGNSAHCPAAGHLYRILIPSPQGRRLNTKLGDEPGPGRYPLVPGPQICKLSIRL